jgi:hypothetical protein
MRRRLYALAWVGALSGLFFASCLATRDKPFVRQTEDDAGSPGPVLLDGDVSDASPDALAIAPHAVLGVDPPHGPFAGGTLVTVRGNGFESNARVWFGDVEVSKTGVTPIDPQRLQVLTPPGSAGAVDIRVQNGEAESTSAELSGGYTYDAFYAVPASGPTSGGTTITLKGNGTRWDENVEVEIDRRPCLDLQLLSETELTCTTPAGETGAKVLSVIAGTERQDVLDGFLYGNGDNGFRGGLSGDALSDELTIVVLDVFEGQALPGVSVLVGDNVDDGEVKRTDRNGVVTFSGELGPKQTITLAMKCFQPITFFDVDVDHLTAYLEPVLSPDCADLGELELPPGGGTPGVGSSISGEVVWEPDGELRRRGWTNVPRPAVETEKDVAYVFRLSDDPEDTFRLPSPGSAITRESTGTLGYSFFQSTMPGNFTLYTLAGLEDSSKTPRKFTAYAMGILRGVAVKPGQSTEAVFIEVDVPLDHALELTLDPPTPGPRGPDRIRASVAIQVQDQGYAILPSGIKEHPLPGAKDFSFVGVPPLVGTLAGSKYVLGARAVTGASGTTPLSVIGSFSTTSSAERLNLGGFVPLPVLLTPVKNTNWDLRTLELAAITPSKRVDLTVIDVEAGGGLYFWRIVAPGAREQLVLPDLEALAPDAALPVGSLRINTTFAHIQDFVYGKLRYRQLARRGWTAYATDTNLSQH